MYDDPEIPAIYKEVRSKMRKLIYSNIDHISLRAFIQMTYGILSNLIAMHEDHEEIVKVVTDSMKEAVLEIVKKIKENE